MATGEDGNPMTVVQHIEEIRARLLRCLVVFFLAFFIFYHFADLILAALRQPLFRILPETERKLYFTSLFENFAMHLRVAVYAALMLPLPFYLREAWSFVAPGLKAGEKKMLRLSLGIASLFFLAGVGFSYCVVLPLCLEFFLHYGAASDVPLLTLGSYYGVVLKMLLAFGFLFELPVFLCLLAYFGLLGSEALIAHRREAVIAVTVAAAVLAPPDVLSMFLFGVPMMLLYELGIKMIVVMEKFRSRRANGIPIA